MTATATSSATAPSLPATPLADALLHARQAIPVQFQSLPLAGGASVQGSPVQAHYEQLFGRDYLLSESLVAGRAFDSFFFPERAIREAEQLAAQAFGAQGAMFVTTGTTVSNQIAIDALLPARGGRVLADRQCHQSVHFALHRANAQTDYLEPATECELTGRGWWSLEQLVQQVLAAQAQGGCDLLVLNGQSYDGVMYDISAVLHALHTAGARIGALLVDEAWGSAAYFDPTLAQRSAMHAARSWAEVLGIPIVATHSVHKSMSALRQASMLLWHGAQMEEKLRLSRYKIHTTSPSYPALASLDLARAQMQACGAALMARSAALAQQLQTQIEQDATLSLFGIHHTSLPAQVATYAGLDPTKVSIDTRRTGLDSAQIKERLFSQYGLWVNRCTSGGVLFNLHIGIQAPALAALLDALRDIQRQLLAPTRAQSAALPAVTTASTVSTVPAQAALATSSPPAAPPRTAYPVPAPSYPHHRTPLVIMIKLQDIQAIATARGEFPAIVTEGYSWSWHTYAATVRHISQALCQRFDAGAITQAAFISDNRPELVALMAVFSTLGIPLAGVDYSLDSATMQRALQAIGANFLILASRTIGLTAAQALQQAQPDRPVIDLDGQLDGAVALSQLQLPLDGPEVTPPSPRPLRSVLFTSGTSGDPKPVLRHQSIDVRRFGYFTRRYGFHAQDRFLVSIPLYHVAGSGWARNFQTLGAALYLAPIGQIDLQTRWIVQHGITATVTTPGHLEAISEAIQAVGAGRARSLRFVLVGGKNFSAEQKIRMRERLGPVVHEYYGSTETGVNTIAEPQDLLSHPQSVGRPYDGNQLRILDEQHQPLPTGEVGSVAIHSYLMMDHYADGSAQQTFVNGQRYLITPDRGYLDAQDRLYVLNRAAGAHGNFDTYALEAQLRQLPGVRDVALMLHADAAEQPQRRADCALVLSAPTHALLPSDVTANQPVLLLQRARQLMQAAGLTVQRVQVVDSIPYNLSGKVRWPQLERLLDVLAGPVCQAA
jgi:arginine decarboxylase